MFARKFAVSAVLALGAFGVSVSASATNFGASVTAGIGGAIGGFEGKTSGYVNSATTGGSMAESGGYGNHAAAQRASNNGGGFASVTGHVTPNGVYTGTNGGSHAENASSGFTRGTSTGQASGAVGTDFSSKAFGEHKTYGAGAGVVLGGFGAIRTGFGSF